MSGVFSSTARAIRSGVTRLVIGAIADGQVLKRVGTTIVGATDAGGDVVGPASSVDSEIALFSGTGGKTIKRASTTGILKATSGVIAAAVAGTDYATQASVDAKANDADVVHDTSDETIAGVKTFTSDPIIPDEAYGVGWNGSLEPPTKNAVYDKVETLGAGYLKYVALLTQSGTDAPMATVLENTLGGTVVWTRNTAGLYEGTLAGAFTNNKTTITCSQTDEANVVGCARTDLNIVRVVTTADSTLSAGNVVEIRVYP